MSDEEKKDDNTPKDTIPQPRDAQSIAGKYDKDIVIVISVTDRGQVAGTFYAANKYKQSANYLTHAAIQAAIDGYKEIIAQQELLRKRIIIPDREQEQRIIDLHQAGEALKKSNNNGRGLLKP